MNASRIGPTLAVETQRALVGAACRVDPPEAQLEDPCALDVQPAGEVRLRGERIGHAPEVRDEIFPGVVVGAFGEGATDQVGLEPLQRSGVMRRATERELPRLAGVVRAVAGLEEARLLGEQLDGRRFARGDRELALEVTQHRNELRARVEAPAQDRVRGRHVRGRP